MFGLIRFIGLFGGLCRLPGFRSSLRLFGADRIRFRCFFLLFRLYFLNGFRRCFNLLAFLSRRRFGFRGALNTLRKRKRLRLIFIRRGIVAACKHDQQKSRKKSNFCCFHCASLLFCRHCNAKQRFRQRCETRVNLTS